MTFEAEIEQLVLGGATERQIWDVVNSRRDGRDGRIRRVEGIDVEPTTLAAAERDNAMYAWLRSLSISAAPEVVATHCFGRNCLSVRRHWACPGEKLVPLHGSGLTLRVDSRERFVADMQRLYEHGKLYPYIRGDAHWLVSEKTGVIVVSPWLLTDAEPREWEDNLGAIDRTFARYS